MGGFSLLFVGTLSARHVEAMSNAIKLPFPVVIPVAGVSYRQGVVRSLSEGTRILLKRDRDNEFDENAIALYTLSGDHIGFAPRAVADKFSKEPYERWGGEVAEVLRGETWGIRVRVTHSNVRDFPTRSEHASFIPPVPVDLPNIDGSTEEAEERAVYARSGRRLGVAVDFTPGDKFVSVLAEGGQRRLFPAGTVIVKEAREVH